MVTLVSGDACWGDGSPNRGGLGAGEEDWKE